MRKKFLFKFIRFVTPMVLLILFIEQQYRSIPNDYTYKSEYLQNQGGQIEVLALGGSHNYRGIDPDLFDKKGFNAAMVSQSINIDYFILKKYKDQLTNLQYVIIPISYPTLTTTMEESRESWRKYRYIHYMGYDELTLKDMFSINRYLAISQETGISIIKNLYRYWFHGRNFRDCQPNGWGKSGSYTPQNLEYLAKEAAQRHEDHSFDMSENMKYLNGLIRLSREGNYKLLLITTPATKYYTESLNDKKWSMIMHTCDSIAKNHAHVKYFNLLYDSTFTDSLFLDGDHLNSEGAQLLTRKLNEKIDLFSWQVVTGDSSIQTSKQHKLGSPN